MLLYLLLKILVSPVRFLVAPLEKESYNVVALFFYIFIPCLSDSLSGLFKP